MVCYIVSTGEMKGNSAKFVQLKNAYNCNAVCVNRIVVSNYSSSDCKVEVYRNIGSAGIEAIPKKGCPTDLSNKAPSKSTLIYNPNFTNEFKCSNIMLDNTCFMFDSVCKPGNLEINFDNPIIMKPGNSLSCLIQGDDKNDLPISCRFEYEETNANPCYY